MSKNMAAIGLTGVLCGLLQPALATTPPNQAPMARAHMICERILRIGEGDGAFARCVDSLTSSVQASGQALSLQPIRIPGSEEDDGLPYFANSAGTQFYRDQQACTQLGLTARAETNCVMTLAAVLDASGNLER